MNDSTSDSDSQAPSGKVCYITRQLLIAVTSHINLEQVHSLDLHIRDSSKGKIRQIQTLNLLPNLVFLNLSFNAISRIEGLSTLTNLKELNLAENAIEKIEGLENLSKLSKLNLSGNRITRIPESISSLTSLGLLRLARNDLVVVNDIRHLGRLGGLHTLRIDENPICEDQSFYFVTIQSIPTLRHLNGHDVTVQDRLRSTAAGLRSAALTNPALFVGGPDGVHYQMTPSNELDVASPNPSPIDPVSISTAKAPSEIATLTSSLQHETVEAMNNSKVRLEVLASKLMYAENEKQNLRIAMSAGEQKIREVENNLNAAKSEIINLRSLLHEANVELSDLKFQQSSRDDAARIMSTELETVKESLIDSYRELEAKRAQLLFRDENLAELVKEKQELLKDRARADIFESKAEADKIGKAALEFEINQLKAQVASLTAENSGLKYSLDEVQSKFRTALERIGLFDSDMAAARQEWCHEKSLLVEKINAIEGRAVHSACSYEDEKLEKRVNSSYSDSGSSSSSDSEKPMVSLPAAVSRQKRKSVHIHMSSQRSVVNPTTNSLPASDQVIEQPVLTTSTDGRPQSDLFRNLKLDSPTEQLVKYLQELKTNAYAREDLVCSREEFRTLQELISRCNHELEKVEIELRAKKLEYSTIIESIDTTTRLSKTLAKENGELDSRAKAKRDEIQALQDSINNLTAELSNQRLILNETVAVISRNQEGATAAQLRIDELRQEIIPIEEKLSKTRRICMEEENRLIQIKQTSSDQIQLLQEDVSRIVKELKSSKAALSELESEKKFLLSDIARSKHKFEMQLAAAERSANEELLNVQTLRIESKQLRSDITDLTSTRSMLQDEVSQLFESKSTTKELMLSLELEHKRKVEYLQNQWIDFESKLRDEKIAHASLQTEIGTLRVDIQEMQHHHAELQRDLQHRQATVKDETVQYEKQIQLCLKSLRQLQAQEDHQRLELEKINSEYRTKECKLIECRRQYRDEEEAYNILLQRKKAMLSEYDVICRDVETAQRNEEHKLRELSELNGQLESNSRSLEDVKKKIIGLYDEEAMLVENNSKLKAVLVATKQSLHDLTDELGSIQATVLRERAVMSSLGTMKATLEAEVRRFESELSVMKKCVQTELSRRSDAETATNSISQTIAENERTLCTLKEEIEDSTLRLDYHKGLESRRNAETRKYQHELLSLRSTIDDERKALNALRIDCQSTRFEFDQCNEALRSLKADEQACQQALDNLRGQCSVLETCKSDLNVEMIRLRDLLRDKQAKIDRADVEVAARVADLEHIRLEIKDLEDRRKSVESAKYEEETKLASFRQAIENSKGELQILRNSISAVNSALLDEQNLIRNQMTSLKEATREANSNLFLVTEAKQRVARRNLPADRPTLSPNVSTRYVASTELSSPVSVVSHFNVVAAPAQNVNLSPLTALHVDSTFPKPHDLNDLEVEIEKLRAHSMLILQQPHCAK